MIYFSPLNESSQIKYSLKFSLIKSFNEFLPFEEEFDVLRLTVLTKKGKQHIHKGIVKYVEDKINCQELSFYFLLPQKFIIYYA